MSKTKEKQPYVEPKTVTPSASQVSIEQPKVFSICAEVAGTLGVGLIQNNFCQKSIEQMLRKHMGFSVQKEVKVPRQCIEDAKILNVLNAICIPPTAFKKGMLTASAQIKGLQKTKLRPLFWLEGKSIPITFEEMVPRMDMVRVANGQPDVRFRPMFMNWKARLIIQFSGLIPAQTVMDLLNRAGAVGVGEWRPENDGTFGTYYVSRNITDAKETAEVREQCRPMLVPLVIPPWAMDAELTPDLLQKLASRPGDEESPEEADALVADSKQPEHKKKVA